MSSAGDSGGRDVVSVSHVGAQGCLVGHTVATDPADEWVLLLVNDLDMTGHGRVTAERVAALWTPDVEDARRNLALVAADAEVCTPPCPSLLVTHLK